MQVEVTFRCYCAVYRYYVARETGKVVEGGKKKANGAVLGVGAGQSGGTQLCGRVRI